MRPFRLELQPGESLAIIGAKGSGKSTFCKLFVHQIENKDYIRPIYINEKIINNDDPAVPECSFLVTAESTGYLVPSLTVAENIFLGRQLTGSLGKINWNKIYSESQEILAKLEITDIRFDQEVKELSLIQKIIVIICRQYSRTIQFFIFDEITRNLDSNDADYFYRILDQLKKAGKNIIYVPYRIEEIFRVVDKAAILYKWEITGSVNDLSSISYERIINVMMGQEQNSNPFTDLFVEKYHITEREKEIIILIANGFSNQDICERLDISVGTVKNHIYNLFQKTEVKNRMELCNLIRMK